MATPSTSISAHTRLIPRVNKKERRYGHRQRFDDLKPDHNKCQAERSSGRGVDAVRLMRDKAVRRILVLDGDNLVGVLSIGDLAIDPDPDSALADVSAEEANV